MPGLWHETLRHPFARVRGIDLDGNEIELEGNGLMAQALQHETDHLDGMLYLDRLQQETSGGWRCGRCGSRTGSDLARQWLVDAGRDDEGPRGCRGALRTSRWSVHDRVALGGGAPEYIDSISPEKSSRMTLRLMLIFGVRCPLASVELRREDRELADGLGARDVLVRGVDRPLHLGEHSGVAGRLRRRSCPASSPLLLSHTGSISGSSVMSAEMNGFLSPTTTTWPDQRVGADGVLERGRGDVLAAGGDDDLLLAAGDREEALVVEGAEVAGLEPVAVEGLGGRLGVLPVLLEDVDAA